MYTYEAAHNFCLHLCLHLVKTSLDCTSTLHCSRALQKGDSQGIVRKRCVSSFTCVRTSKQCTPAWWRRCCVWVKSLYQYTNYGLERFQSQSVLVEFGKPLRCETVNWVSLNRKLFECLINCHAAYGGLLWYVGTTIWFPFCLNNLRTSI